MKLFAKFVLTGEKPLTIGPTYTTRDQTKHMPNRNKDSVYKEISIIVRIWHVCGSVSCSVSRSNLESIEYRFSLPKKIEKFSSGCHDYT